MLVVVLRRVVVSSVVLLAPVLISGVAQARAYTPASAAPTVRISARPAANSASTTARFSFTKSSKTAKTFCKLDAGAYAACGSPKTYTKLRNAAHTFTVKATIGSVSRTAVAHWRVDTIRPTLPAMSSPVDWHNAASQTVTGHSTDANGSGVLTYDYETSIDRGAHWSGILSTSLGHVTVGREGETLVRIRARDRAGNVSSFAAPAAVKLDRTAPSAPTISGAPDGAWTNVNTLLTAGGSTDAAAGVDGRLYEWIVSTNGGAYSSPGEVFGPTESLTAAADYLVFVRARDRAGNVSAWSDVAEVDIDRTAPSVPSVTFAQDGQALAEASDEPSVTGGDDQDGPVNTVQSGFAYYECRSKLPGDADYMMLDRSQGDGVVIGDGDHAVGCRSVDHAGNHSAWSADVHVVLDSLPPANDTVGTGYVLWKGSSDLAVATPPYTDQTGPITVEYQTSTDEGLTWSAGWTALADPSDAVTVSGPGTTMIKYRAIDGIGNTSGETWPITVETDTTAPTVPTVMNDNPGWTMSDFDTASGSEDSESGEVQYFYRASDDGGGSWSAWTAGDSAGISSEGDWLVQHEACDAVGNCSDGALAQTEMKIDTTPPDRPTVTGGTGGSCVAGPVTFTASSGDGLSGLSSHWYSMIIDTDTGNLIPPYIFLGDQVTISDPGHYAVSFWVYDAAQNQSLESDPNDPDARTCIS